MTNIWEFSPGEMIAIDATDGDRITGEIISINDVEEETDLGFKEDSISIAIARNTPVTILQSEILNIERI